MCPLAYCLLPHIPPYNELGKIIDGHIADSQSESLSIGFKQNDYKFNTLLNLIDH